MDHTFLAYICYDRQDLNGARWLYNALQRDNLPIFLDIENIFDGTRWDDQVADAIANSSVFIVLISPNSAKSQTVVQEINIAHQYQRPIVPVLINETTPIPWFVQSYELFDFTTNRERQLRRLITQHLLPSIEDVTLGQAADAYINRGSLKSQHTLDSYRRAIELFFLFLKDRSTRRLLPIQRTNAFSPEDIPITALSEQDVPILLHFAQWMLSPSSGIPNDRRPYKASTIELRLAGIQNWFQFLDDYGWLPPQFKLAKARRMVRDELRGRPQRSGAPQPPEHIEELIYFYDTQPLPTRLQKPNIDPERLERWELTRARNCALLHTLAETGGRISEILSLNIGDFPVRALERDEVLRIQVLGKGGHSYNLRLYDALSAIRAYIKLRGSNLRASRMGQVPLFVSHDNHYDGHRMSRVIAWRVVQCAARSLGVHDVTPHDFRHWRATQLINAGHPLDVVQEYLGHRSVETTRAYYAHTDPLRVDDAAKTTRLPDSDDFPN